MTTEPSICAEARRLAQVKRDENAAKHDPFVTSLTKGQFTRNADGTYQICGWMWRVNVGVSFGPDGKEYCYLSPVENTHRGMSLWAPGPSDIQQLGESLLHLDDEVAKIDVQYPDTLWGRFRLWFATH